MTIRVRDGDRASPATVSVRLEPNIGDTSYLGAGSVIGVTVEVFDASDTALGPTVVAHTVADEDNGFDHDVGGVPLHLAMEELCRKVIANSPQPVECYPLEVGSDEVEIRVQPNGASEQGAEHERVSLTNWNFRPISPPVVSMKHRGVNILQNAGTRETPATLMVSGSHWPEGFAISLRLDTNLDDPTVVGINAEAEDTAQIMADKVAAFVNSLPTLRAETDGRLVKLYAVAPAGAVSVNASMLEP